MTVTFGAAGTAATSTTTSISVPYPSGITAGQKLVLATFGRVSGGGTVNTPSGWTHVPGSPSPTVGSAWIQVFTKTAVGTESGSLSVTTASAFSTEAVMFRFTTSLGNWDTDAAGSGTDSSAGFIVTTDQTIDRQSGDLLVGFATTNSATLDTWSSETIDGNSITNRYFSQIVSTANTCRVSESYTTTTGTSAVTYSATLSTNRAGSGLVLRLRDYASFTAKRQWGAIPIKSDS